MDVAERREKLVALADVFRPSGPVDTGDLFKGRTTQIVQVGQALATAGRHAVIYGERGVGKTSLAAISEELFPLTMAIRVNCDEGDNFASIWEKVALEAHSLARLPSWHHGDMGRDIVNEAATAFERDAVGPDAVRHFMRMLSTLGGRIMIFLDEYDQVCEPGVGPLMANTIKALADHLVAATVCILGVADDVETLIASHASVERNLEEISMPRMTPDEIRDIVSGGYGAIGITIEDAALAQMVRLPQGLPHFGHLLAQKAGEAAILLDTLNVTTQHVRLAIREAVGSSEASLTQTYVEATASSHKETLYDDVLLACALTPIDELGYFTPGDLREPLAMIRGEWMEIARFARHLVQFCQERGPILERKGGDRHWRYRFKNPRMRPYIIMRAIDAGLDLLGIRSEIALFPTEP